MFQEHVLRALELLKKVITDFDCYSLLLRMSWV